MRKLLTLAGLVGTYVYFFDKDSGARRRAEARDRVLALLNSVRRLEAPTADDASPAAKVES
jgi:hypothetical protein